MPDNKDMKERRNHERFSFREDILVDGTRMCSCLDISEGGLYATTIQCYEEDSIIDIAIPFKGDKLELKAQIRYCQPGIGMGVMFVNLNDIQRARIKELIDGIAKRPAQTDSGGKNVLLVEDNQTARQAIKGALSKEGFRVREAGDGLEAIRSVEEQGPDLIILDLYMKGMDGLKVLSFLKTDVKWKELPVIVCSAYDTQDMREKVMNAGADEFIPKRGTSPAKLVQSAKAVLQQRVKA